MGRRVLKLSTELIGFILEKGFRQAVPVEPLAGARVVAAELERDVLALTIESPGLVDADWSNTVETPGEAAGSESRIFEYNPTFRTSYQGAVLYLVGSGARIYGADRILGDTPWRIRAIVDSLAAAQELCREPGDFHCMITVGEPFPERTADVPSFTAPFGWLDVPFDLGVVDLENPDGEVAGA